MREREIKKEKEKAHMEIEKKREWKEQKEKRNLGVRKRRVRRKRV